MQLAKELDQERRRVRAAMGIDAPDPDEAERQALAQQLKKAFPRLGKILDLEDTQFENLLGAPDQISHLSQMKDFVYGQVADRMMGSVESAIAEELGSDLTPLQKRAIGMAYYQRAESDPDFLSRHEAQDATLVDEFVKEWLDGWVTPIRRNLTRNNVERANPRVPRGRDRAVVVQGKPDIDYSNEEAVNKAALQRFKDLGGNFGNG